MNISEKMILAHPWPFLQKASTVKTASGIQFYNLPFDVGKVLAVYVTVSSNRYAVKEASARMFWDKLNFSTYTSDIPEWYFVFNGQIGIWPVPATAGNVITVVSRRLPKDLTIADYTTGGIASIANGDTLVTGVSVSWSQPMAGRYIRITDSSTINSGDGFWYQIASTPAITTTQLNLVSPYGGTSIVSGNAAYTIGQMSYLPEAYEQLSVYDALRQYFGSVQPDASRAKFYDTYFKEMYKRMMDDLSSVTDDMVIFDGRDRAVLNPNLFIRL